MLNNLFKVKNFYLIQCGNEKLFFEFSVVFDVKVFRYSYKSEIWPRVLLNKSTSSQIYIAQTRVYRKIKKTKKHLTHAKSYKYILQTPFNVSHCTISGISTIAASRMDNLNHDLIILMQWRIHHIKEKGD